MICIKRKVKVSYKKAFLINIIICFLWHLCSFLLCVHLKGQVFDYNRKCYQPKKWEKNGKWYKEKLKINKWKDILPQHVGEGGFSKEHMQCTSVKYIDDFLYETCRGEFNHKNNAIFAFFIFWFNKIKNFPKFISVIFCVCTLIANLPFLAIQRYNRFRLLKVRERLVKRKNR